MNTMKLDIKKAIEAFAAAQAGMTHGVDKASLQKLAAVLTRGISYDAILKLNEAPKNNRFTL